MISPSQYSTSLDSAPLKSVTDIESAKTAEMLETAKAFEAAFITQMLTFSGLGDALTLGGGDDMSAFSSFYIESLAEKITDQGGFGLAKQFYSNMSDKMQKTENENVDFGTM